MAGNLARKFLLLASCILICEFAGLAGSFFTAASVSTWYPALQKPAFTPPNRVFAPVWSLLYLLMGISLFLILRGAKKPEKNLALGLFSFQLLLNILWSAVFFGLKSPLGGLMVIILLWAAILGVLISFYRLNKAAGLLQIPYLLWVSFAFFLNFSIYRLN